MQRHDLLDNVLISMAKAQLNKIEMFLMTNVRATGSESTFLQTDDLFVSLSDI